MRDTQNAIEAAIKTGIVQCRSDPNELEAAWENVSPRVELFSSQVQGRVTLFLGSAVSSFKPAKLPMWNKFIELLWSSLLSKAISSMQESEDLAQAFMSYFSNIMRSNKVPNYMITEIIARRFGKQYLSLLEAFAAQKTGGGTWAVNHVHKWAAHGLADGSVSAIMTTNFDDYLERALEDTNAPYYQITGNPHIDGPEILDRLHDTSVLRKLVLIVNGGNAFSFVRSLMPQLGRGKMTFLFKLHGSCYEPESCIDTRLQRAQGLPSYLTDVIDTLLQRSVWFVAGFSGSDMNDNLDYLRFLSNKRHARVVWLTFPGGYMEGALQNLMKTMDQTSKSAQGLALLHGYFAGERTSAMDIFPLFDEKVESWANNLGSEWCKLVVIDLMVFLQARTEELADPALLKKLNQGYEDPRQDWNAILQGMDLKGQESQTAVARLCREASEILQQVLDLENGSMQTDHVHWCGQMDSILTNLNAQHVTLQSATEVDGNRPHAQSWVLSCLSGLILLCSDQAQAALRAFDISSSTAWMVGDFETHELIRDAIPSLVLGPPPVLSDKDTGDLVGIEKLSTYVAFISELDNVNAKMNRFGIPPEHYVRALLNRSILFTDGFAVPPNILTNSSVFVSEILFQNDRQEYNSQLLQHLFPLLPRSLQGTPKKLQAYRTLRQQNYVREPIDEEHIRKLDEYFEKPPNSERFIYYDEERISQNYGACIRKLVDPIHADVTVEHLVRMWSNTEAGGWWNPTQEVHEERAIIARDCAQKLLKSLRQFVQYLPKAVFRSVLYRFADLFDEASDPEPFIQGLPDITPETAFTLLSSREEIINKPWVYGPFCKELFDAPYKTNLAFEVASRSECDVFIFLEQDALSSWELMSAIRGDDAHPVCFGTFGDSNDDVNAECSSLLLSQVTYSAIAENRKGLAPIREKISSGSRLNEQDKMRVRSVMRNFTQSSLQLEGSKVEKLAILTDEHKACAKTLLKQCTFLVRRGQALDRMYQEAQLSVPGLVSLRRM